MKGSRKIVLCFSLAVVCIFLFSCYAFAGKKTVDDGLYFIKSALNTKQAVDVNGGNQTNGTKIQLWNSNARTSQQFRFVYRKGFYYIYNVNCDKVLDVQGGVAKNGTKVQLYKYNGSKAQRWELVSVGGNYSGGWFRIKSALGNYYLDCKGGKYSNGTQIQIYKKNGSNAQKFYLQPIVKYEYKTVTLSTPTSVQDWLSKIRSAEQSISSSNWSLCGDGKYRTTGPIIVGVEVLGYSTVKYYLPIQGPTVDGKSPSKTTYIKLPTKLRYKTHKHTVGLYSTASFWGNFLQGIANLTATATYSCPCGIEYKMEWKMPDASKLTKACNSRSAANVTLNAYTTSN